MASTMQLQEVLLQFIQPHLNISAVDLCHYIGERLPIWMQDPSYWRLKIISLGKCKNCKCLPALGQLPSLESLTVSSMHALTSVGHEFLGDKASAFPSLEKLIFHDLPELKELLRIGTEEGGAFPCLGELVIRSCHRLVCIDLRHLMSLRELNIGRCNELVMLDYCSVSISLSDLSLSRLQQESVHHMHIPCVRTMLLRDCAKLSLPLAGEHLLPSSLRTLDTSGSPLLTKWVAGNDDKLVGIPWLWTDGRLWRSRLAICNVEDVEEAEDIGVAFIDTATNTLELRWDLEQQEGFSSSTVPEEAAEQQVLKAARILVRLRPPHYSPLQVLFIGGYRGRRFPDWVGEPSLLPNLVKMSLSHCVHCERLPPLGQLPSLRKLYILEMYMVEHVGCEFFAEEWRRSSDHPAFPNLQLLSIDNFPMLRVFQLPSDLPSSSSNTLSLNSLPLLEVLAFKDCPEFISLIGMHKFPSLRFLRLGSCPALQFTQDARLPPQLRFVFIVGNPLLAAWFQGHQLNSQLRLLLVDDNKAISDGTSEDEIFNFLGELS